MSHSFDSVSSHSGGSLDFHPTHIDSHGISGHIDCTVPISVNDHWSAHIGIDAHINSGHHFDSGISGVTGSITYQW